MGYIKKLKNNELVGGTDKHTIYPVTSAEAVFEEVIEDGESNFKSQKFLNNNITGDRINEGTITDYNIAVGTVTKEKLTPQVQTMLDEGQKKALTPKGDYNSETVYEALDLVFDRESNSSYVSLITPNTEPLTNEDAWEMFLDGTAVNTAQATINDKVEELDTQVTGAIGQAQQDVRDLVDETAEALARATSDAIGATEDAMAAAHQKVSDAQIGYYISNTAAATALKQTTTNIVGEDYYAPASGGAMKIYMQYANTATDTIELQFGSNTATRKQLIYNGEPASNSNSWDDGEVISVYYDPTYNNNTGAYQASNAMGGGSAIGKKKLNGISNYYIDLSGGVGTTLPTRSQGSAFNYIIYPVKEGDVISITGRGRGSKAHTWGMVDSEDKIVKESGEDVSLLDNYILVIPEGVAKIVLNNCVSGDNSYPDYEWYYAKKGSVGAHEMLTEAYLYKDVRTLGVGELYEINEAVASSGKQLLRITTPVKNMTLTEKVTTGDLRAITSGVNLGTYQAITDVDIYNGTEEDGHYYVGSPAGAVIEITVDSTAISALTEDTPITITIADVEIEILVNASSTASTIASAISDAFDLQEKWSCTVDSENTNRLLLKSLVAIDVLPTVTSDTGTTGVSVDFVTDSAYAGSLSISKYENEAWTIIELGDSNIWGEPLNVYQLADLCSEQNTVPKLYGEYGVNANGSITQEFITDAIAYSESNNTRTSYSYTLVINPSTGRWYDFSKKYCSYILIESSKGNAFRLTAGGRSCVYAWFANKPISITKNTTPPYVAGTTVMTIPAGDSEVVTAPDGAAYLYITNTIRVDANSETLSYAPKYIGDVYNPANLLEAMPLSDLDYITSPQGYLEGRTSNIFYFTLSSNYRGYFVNLKDFSGKILRFKEVPRCYMFLSELPSSSSGSFIYDKLLGVGAVRGDRSSVIIPNAATEGGDVWFWYWTVFNGSVTHSLRNVEIVSHYSELINNELLTTKDTLDQEACGIPFKQIKLARYTNDNENAFGILHYSDVHGDILAVTELLEFMLKYKTVYGVPLYDEAIESGDRVYHTFGDAKYAYLLSPKALFVLGNHDDSEYTVSKQTCYETWFEPYIEGWGVDSPADDGEHQYAMYWKKDYILSSQKIRIIGLDCQHYQGRTADYTSRDQEDWFKDTLDDAKINGFKVMVVCHYGLEGYDLSANAEWDETTHTWDYNSIGRGGHLVDPATGEAVAFHSIHNNVKKGGQANSIYNLRVRANVTDPATGNVIPKDTNQFGDILENWIVNDGGEFIAWICGHSHLDHIYYSNDFPHVLTIHVGSLGTRRMDANKQYSRSNGNIQKMLANLYYISGDYLRIIRIGNDMTNNLVSKKWLTLNYKTGKIIGLG